MDTTKIRLSTEEEALVCRTDWILTKNRIIEKIKALFASLQTQQQGTFELSQSFYDEELQSTPKISKGENYRGLPYLVLDYPRFFNKEDIFVIRSFFLVGQFFSAPPCNCQESLKQCMKRRSLLHLNIFNRCIFISA